MKNIPLTQGWYALVDDADYERVSQFKWMFNKGYACRSVLPADGGNAVTVYMHRYITGLEAGDVRHVDHRNLDTLDNRRLNLRVCDEEQNARNRGKQRNNTSGFKGVSRLGTKWRASINFRKRQYFLGSYATPEEAYEVYCLWADMLHGEFANYGGIAA